MDNIPLTKEKIKQLIKNHDPCLSFVKSESSLSQVWSSFSYVHINHQKQNFVACDRCKDVLHHKSGDGTSNMLKHNKSCEKSNKNISIHHVTIEDDLRRKSSSPIPKLFKDKITEAAVEFVALDCRAFELVSGDGFTNLAQAIFNVGQNLHRISNVNVSDLIPNSTTISRNIDRMYENKKFQLKKLCENRKSYTVLVDFWTDSHTGVSFCGIALSYLNEDLQLHVFILGCFPYDRDNQTANQIRQFVDSKLLEFSLSLDENKFVVTDNENKMKAAFKDLCCRIGCSIHCVNKQLEHCFTAKIVDKLPVNCEIAQEMFIHVRDMVSQTRKTHKQSKLSRKLQSYSKTRFNGAFLMMDVVLFVFEELPAVLDRIVMNDYEPIDKDLLSDVCSFLKPFETIFNELSCDTKPTIYKVLPFKQYLLNHCKIHTDDHDGIQQVKTFLEKRIQDIWMLHDVHYVTTLLHPSLKNFDKHQHLHATAVDLTKKELLKRQSSASNKILNTGVQSLSVMSEPDLQSSAAKTLLSQCFDAPKGDVSSTKTPYNELEEYLALHVRLNENDDVLEFCLSYKNEFPLLFTIVQDLYAIPASNTTIERLFSASKNTISDKRTSLGAEKVNKLLFLQKNLHLLKELSKQSMNESLANPLKRTTNLSCTNPEQNQDLCTTATAVKKFRINEQDDIGLCEHSTENNEIDHL